MLERSSLRWTVRLVLLGLVLVTAARADRPGVPAVNPDLTRSLAKIRALSRVALMQLRAVENDVGLPYCPNDKRKAWLLASFFPVAAVEIELPRLAHLLSPERFARIKEQTVAISALVHTLQSVDRVDEVASRTEKMFEQLYELGED